MNNKPVTLQPGTLIKINENIYQIKVIYKNVHGDVGLEVEEIEGD
jgi:hypothetical protein